MIEVNLLPPKGKRKRTRRGAPSLAIPSVPGLPRDPWILGAGLLVLLALVGISVMFFRVAGAAEEVQVQIEVAQADSARFADIIVRSERLQSQRDSIAERVAVLQEIDETRYVWPHILDEVGRALPAFTWLTRVQQVMPGTHPVIRVEGRSATYFALTSFMEALEGSPFLGDVRLISVDALLLTVSAGIQRRVYHFQLEASYRDPPPGIVERIPLFGSSALTPLPDGLDGESDGVNDLSADDEEER